jgi:hypothetical protein
MGKFYYSNITTKIGNQLVAITTNVTQLFIKKGEGEMYCTRFFVLSESCARMITGTNRQFRT